MTHDTLYVATEDESCDVFQVLETAEGILVDTQNFAQDFPRGALELRILETLREFSPMALAAKQIADQLRIPRDRCRAMMQALCVLETIERDTPGFYKYKAL